MSSSRRRENDPMPHHRVVVDASVWVSLFIRDALYADSRSWVTEYTRSGGKLIDPGFVLLEAAAAVSRATGDPALTRRILATLVRVPELTLVELSSSLLQQAIDVAADTGLRAGDAIYAALAQQEGIPLVTWDMDFQRRVGSRITILAPNAFPS